METADDAEDTEYAEVVNRSALTQWVSQPEDAQQEPKPFFLCVIRVIRAIRGYFHHRF